MLVKGKWEGVVFLLVCVCLGLICLCSVLIFGQQTNQPQAFKGADFNGVWIPKTEKDAFPGGDGIRRRILENQSQSVRQKL